MNEEFVRELAAFLAKRDHACPFSEKPKKGLYKIYEIPVEDRGVWVLAASLQRAGFKREGQHLANIIGQQTVASIETGIFYAIQPKYYFCSDWWVYSDRDDLAE